MRTESGLHLLLLDLQHPTQCLANCMLRKDLWKKVKCVLYSSQLFLDISNPYLADPINSQITMIFSKVVSFLFK